MFLTVLFFATAIFYAAVGFGGGSTYNALLVLHGVDYKILPAIALLCNVIVVSGGVWRFSKEGHVSVSRLAPFLATSLPAAFIGGLIAIPESLFVGLLGGSLFFAGARLLFMNREQVKSEGPTHSINWTLSGLAGAPIGLLSGLVGIGGGIFLAPVLYLLRWGAPRQIAGACSLFILVNSLSGLSGQLLKLNDLSLFASLQPYWFLFPAVLVGGQIGSHAGSAQLPASIIKKMTAALILYVSARLIYRWLTMVGFL